MQKWDKLEISKAVQFLQVTSSRLGCRSGNLRRKEGKNNWRNIGQGTERPACWLRPVPGCQSE